MRIYKSQLKQLIEQILFELDECDPKMFYDSVRKDQLKWKKDEDPNSVLPDDDDLEKENYEKLINDIKPKNRIKEEKRIIRESSNIWYLGYIEKNRKYVAFSSDVKPTKNTHSEYLFIYGPMRKSTAWQNAKDSNPIKTSSPIYIAAKKAGGWLLKNPG